MNKKENMIKFYKFALVGLSNTLDIIHFEFNEMNVYSRVFLEIFTNYL